jgi:hypothetical protein
MLAGYPDAIVYLLHGASSLLPHALPARSERRHLTTAWYKTARDVGDRLFQARHGARGNAVSEIRLFHPSWWRRNFRENGFAIVHDAPTGLFHTGNMLPGPGLAWRAANGSRRGLAAQDTCSRCGLLDDGRSRLNCQIQGTRASYALMASFRAPGLSDLQTEPGQTTTEKVRPACRRLQYRRAGTGFEHRDKIDPCFYGIG